MKENHEIDKLLRDSLAGSTIQPTEKSRQLFLDNAATLKPVAKQTHKSKFMWVSAVGILLLTGLFIVWMNTTDEKTKGAVSTVTLSDTTKKHSESTITENPAPDNFSDLKETASDAPAGGSFINTQVNGNLAVKQIHHASPVYADRQSEPAQAEPAEYVSATDIENQPSESESTHEQDVALKPKPEEQSIIETPKTVASQKQSTDIKTDYNSNWGIGLFYRPEIILNIIENDKLIHNAGFEIHYRFFGDRYSMRTGAGLSVSKGYYEYAAVYNQFLGTYSALDSISFTLAANNFHLIPTYYKSEKDVHDTSSQTHYAKVYKQHIYLQIPLELGYDLIVQPKYRLGLRFGPTLSVLTNRKPVSFEYDPGKDKLIQINRITPERIITNFHFSGGINYSYLINGFVVEIEPRAAYYFNSVYEKSNTSSPPFSFSIRIAISIY